MTTTENSLRWLFIKDVKDLLNNNKTSPNNVNKYSAKLFISLFVAFKFSICYKSEDADFNYSSCNTRQQYPRYREKFKFLLSKQNTLQITNLNLIR